MPKAQMSPSRRKPQPATVRERLDAWVKSNGEIGMAIGEHETGGMSVCFSASIDDARVFHRRLGSVIQKAEA